MAKPLSELLKKLPNQVNAEATIRAAEILVEMSLSEIRQAQQVTQTQVAEALHIKQPSVAQLEKRGDIYLSTLKNYLSSLGVKLELVARFPDGTRVSIAGFTHMR